jgi:hypothetical protein
LAAVGTCAAVVLAQARAALLNIRAGQWEQTTTIRYGEMAGDAPAAFKTCLTRDKINAAAIIDLPGTTCTQTITKSTSALIEGSVSCTGKTPMAGKMRLDVSSPTSYVQTITSTRIWRGETLPMDVTMKGKWLGANCAAAK